MRGSSFKAIAADVSLQVSSNDSTSLLPFEITQDSDAPVLRSSAIDLKRTTFLYGPPLAGGPSYPIGPLALTKKAADLAAIQLDEAPQLTGSTVDSAEARLNTAEVRRSGVRGRMFAS